MHEFLKKADNITELEKCRVKENGYGYNLLLVFCLDLITISQYCQLLEITVIL